MTRVKSVKRIWFSGKENDKVTGMGFQSSNPFDREMNRRSFPNGEIKFHYNSIFLPYNYNFLNWKLLCWIYEFCRSRRNRKDREASVIKANETVRYSNVTKLHFYTPLKKLSWMVFILCCFYTRKNYFWDYQKNFPYVSEDEKNLDTSNRNIFLCKFKQSPQLGRNERWIRKPSWRLSNLPFY